MKCKKGLIRDKVKIKNAEIESNKVRELKW